MSKTDSRPSIQTQMKESIQEEALKVARSIQKPGQTKEQTKLIAQGIAKGIELYKKQQSAKARERDKARKKALRLKQAEMSAQAPGKEDMVFASEATDWGVRGTLILGGAIFAAIACIFAASSFAGWPVSFGPFTLADWASLTTALASAGLSGWFFYKAFKSRF
ncbi:conserved protein of unknown function [Methylocaldum szegediense]|uniref:DUF2956 domain-containing protein n=2 Tax=Methylocaldum szegediense TaxID=73780 RepID=A0ABN8X9A2_9GAMM|nr:conserved protein of unknown function [Methylocaldum szegediense]